MSLLNNERGPALNVTPAEIYLDAAATTPPHPSVIEAIQQVQVSAWGNPSSLHQNGLIAAEALERSRQSIAQALGAGTADLICTSGATESVHLALLGSCLNRSAGRLVISAVEHPAVTAAAMQLQSLGWCVEIWPVNHNGLIRLDQLERLLAPPTRMVSVIWGQSEVGAIQPVVAIGQACRDRGILFHTDATQVLPQGRISWRQLPIDLLSLSAHKLQGPRGIGLLLKQQHVVIQPLQGGGGQEQGLRSGTESVALMAGLAVALQPLPLFEPRTTMAPPGSTSRLRLQRDRLLADLLRLPGVELCGPGTDHRLPNHIALLLTDRQGQPIPGRRMVRQLARRGIAVSSGSACSSGKSADSPVLTSMGIDPRRCQSGLRLTLGGWIDDDQLDLIPERFAEAMAAVDSSA